MSLRKLGVAVSHLGASHQNYCLLRNIGRELAGRTDLDVVCFYELPAVPCLPPPCAVMQIHELWGFDGVAVATNLTTAEKLINCPAPLRKFFYCWDLEWLRMPHKSFEALRAVYGHPELELVARGKDHAKVLADAWNRPVAVCDDFDLKVFLGEPNGAARPPNA